MTYNFDPAEIDVIEDDYTSNLSYDESENASTQRILGLCEYARGLEKQLQWRAQDVRDLEDDVKSLEKENKDLRNRCQEAIYALGGRP
jgi:DnaJ-domain-containing protein 1